MPDIQFIGLQLNIQQGLVYSNHIGECDYVCAIFDKHKHRIVIQPSYAKYCDQIQDAILVLTCDRWNQPIKYEITYGDGFVIDTWNKLLHPQLASELG